MEGPGGTRRFEAGTPGTPGNRGNRGNPGAPGALGGGRYQLGEFLGSGGPVDVYRATDRRLGRSVLVTLVPQGHDPAAARRFQDETWRLTELSHPGLVTVLDSGVEGEQGFLVTEMVDGEPLGHRLGRNLLSPPEAMRAGADIAEVLAYTHARGVPHRDINPSNVLLGRNQAFLSGFGLAAAVGRGYDAAPEADVYALGQVLLYAVTGATPADGGQRPSIPADLPEPLGRALHAMTQADPAARPTAAQCAAMLAPEPEPVEEPLPRRNSTALRNWLIGAVLFLLLVVLAVLLLNQDSDEPEQPAPPPATEAPASERPGLPGLPGVSQLPGLPSELPDVPDLPSPPSVDLPDLPDIPTEIPTPEIPTPEAPDGGDSGGVWQRIEDWFRSWA